MNKTSEKDFCIAKFKEWLAYVREHQHTGDVDYSVKYVREFVEKAGEPLEYFETNDEELAEILHNGYIAEAKRWLGLARERQHNPFWTGVDVEVGYVRKYAEKSGKSLEYFGTSKEELAQMVENGRKAQKQKLALTRL